MNRKKILDVLAQLQEGYIEEMKLEEGNLNIKVECRHLADQIDANYTSFYVVLKGTTDLYFRPWDDEEVVITSVKDIVLFKPDILNVEYADDEYLKIYSNCENVYSGGCLYFHAADIKVFDEGLNEVKLEDLSELSDNYWFPSDKAEG
ncbi:MAG TPA: hypothetical protein VNB90_11110 [Cytophagaceae bacterium]|jgi:hypothetical protein|nr:hypothetical protein [Cytophagaceae bacterium]